jgi:CII-binding regulator of phage lambda lysogenization HflD
MGRLAGGSAYTGRAQLTVRGLDDGTVALLQQDAEVRGLSLNRYLVQLLDDRAELRRRRDQLDRLGQRLEAVRERLAAQLAAAGRTSSDSAALLWVERGGR